MSGAGGFRGRRGGGRRGGSGGKGRRWDDGNSRRGGRWTYASKNTNYPPAEDSVRSEETVSFWSDAGAAQLPPAEPFIVEEPKTNFHLEALELMKGLREDRNLMVDEEGCPIVDCRGTHGFDRMCQFCDGRRGPWAKETTRSNDQAFRRYQESIVRSGTQQNISDTENPSVSRRIDAGTSNVLKLVPEWVADNEDDFGVLDKNKSIFD